MGKTEKGAIWLNEEMLSPYDYWQFWRNVDDRDVKKFLNLFTDIDPNEIEKIFNNEKNINNLKILLANEATKLLHGNDASKKAAKTAKETFEQGGTGSELPEIKLKPGIISKGISLVEFLADQKITSSKSEARRMIKNKGLKINNRIIENISKMIEKDDFNNNVLKISFGKKKHYLVKIN